MSVRANHIMYPEPRSFAIQANVDYKRAMQIRIQERHRVAVRLKIQRARRRMR